MSRKSYIYAQNWKREFGGKNKRTSQFLNQYFDINSNVTAEKFRGVGLEDMHVVERLAEVYILVYGIEISKKNLMEKLLNNLCEDFVAQLIYYVTIIKSTMSQI